MRLFFGIYPDQNTLAYLRDAYRAFDKEKRNLRPVTQDQLHITLRFVGAKVSDESKNKIITELRARRGNYPRPQIKIKGLQFGFPRQHDPRVLFANIHPSGDLIELQDIINEIIKDFDLRDTITWKPHRDRQFHITIARLKDAATRSTGKKIKTILANANVPTPEPYIAEEMVAIQSILNSKSKPIYRPLERIVL